MISDSKMLPASAILLNQFPGRKHNLFIFLRINGLPLGGAYCLSVHATKQGVATPEHTLLTGLGVAYEGFFLASLSIATQTTNGLANQTVVL